MTAPTITYGHGYLNDCDAALTTKNDSADPLGTVSCTSSSGDIITITGTCDNVADEWVQYRTSDLTALGINSSTYTKALVRYKTSVASNGLGARIHLEYTDATTDWVLGETAPAYSTGAGWATATATLSLANKTLKYVWFWADDYPDTIAAGTYSVAYDFILLHKGTYPFPFISDSLSFKLPNRYADIPIPGRVGDITQFLGAENPTIRLQGTIDTATGWHGDTTLDLERIYQILRESYSNPWQYFTSDVFNGKVTPRNFEIIQDSDNESILKWSLDLKQYSLSGGNQLLWTAWNWY